MRSAAARSVHKSTSTSESTEADCCKDGLNLDLQENPEVAVSVLCCDGLAGLGDQCAWIVQGPAAIGLPRHQSAPPGHLASYLFLVHGRWNGNSLCQRHEVLQVYRAGADMRGSWADSGIRSAATTTEQRQTRPTMPMKDDATDGQYRPKSITPVLSNK